MIFIASISCQTSGNVTARNSGDRKMIRLFELRRVIGQHISSSHLPSHPPPLGETHCTMETQAYIIRMFSRTPNFKMSVWVPKVSQSTLSWHKLDQPQKAERPTGLGSWAGDFSTVLKSCAPRFLSRQKYFIER